MIKICNELLVAFITPFKLDGVRPMKTKNHTSFSKLMEHV